MNKTIHLKLYSNEIPWLPTRPNVEYVIEILCPKCDNTCREEIKNNDKWDIVYVCDVCKKEHRIT